MPTIRAWPIYAPQKTHRCEACGGRLAPPFIRAVGYADRGEPVRTIDLCIGCSRNNPNDKVILAALADALEETE